MDATFHDLFQDSDDPAVHRRQIDALRRSVIGLAQDLAAMKVLLEERQIVDHSAFRTARTQRMIADCSGAGAASWRRYSYYPYLLSDEDYLRHQWRATPQEIAEFRAEVEFVQQLT